MSETLYIFGEDMINPGVGLMSVDSDRSIFVGENMERGEPVGFL